MNNANDDRTFASLALVTSWALATDYSPLAPGSKLCLEGGCRMDQIEDGIDRLGRDASGPPMLCWRPIRPIPVPGAHMPRSWPLAKGDDRKGGRGLRAARQRSGPGISAVWMRAANFLFHS